MRKIFEFKCPNCNFGLALEVIVERLVPSEIKTICVNCYYPLIFYHEKGSAEIRMERDRKSAFLIHSSEVKDKDILDSFRHLLSLYGTPTRIIEEDPRPIDFLQKSFYGIKNAQFTVVLLTKRYQFLDEKLQLKGWKGPDKCYDEIAMSFAFGRDIFAIVEKGVDSGRVLEKRAWYYAFERDPLRIDVEFFQKLDAYLGNV